MNMRKGILGMSVIVLAGKVVSTWLASSNMRTIIRNYILTILKLGIWHVERGQVGVGIELLLEWQVLLTWQGSYPSRALSGKVIYLPK